MRLRRHSPSPRRPWSRRAAVLSLAVHLLAPTPHRAAQPSTHWAFQPIIRPSTPAPQPAPTPPPPSRIDAFLQSRLTTAGLEFAPPASRRTLIRRACHDLHGLPPTADEIAAFEGDDAPDAFARLVDRLLASPRYGERWGRHWLDVARFADTKGYVRLKENPAYVAAWTYRDYVVRAFNEDLPYDRFVVEQIAADRLPDAADPRRLAALGFLTLGQRFINSIHDIIDDRIDVVTRGLMGLTVGCARCHDHKHDPVTMRDYYGLHGIFASSVEPRVPPLIAEPTDTGERARYLAPLAERVRQFEAFLERERHRFNQGFLDRAGDYLLAGQREAIQPNFLAVMFLVDASKELNPVMVQRWCRFLAQSRRQVPTDPVLGIWHELAAVPSERFREAAHDLAAGEFRRPSAGGSVRSTVAHAVLDPCPDTLEALARAYGRLFQAAASRPPPAGGAASPDEAAWEVIGRIVRGPGAPLEVQPADVDDFFFVDITTQNAFQEKQREIEDWIATSASAEHAHIVRDAATPVEPRIFLRGNAANPGERVERRFLGCLTPRGAGPFRDGSGRLELANAIASATNPLTARVLVNRVWMHHFGAGIVRTPGDFGVRGDPPTHPELLEELAAGFIADGWSVKRLHRRLLLTRAYQQSSTGNPDSLQRDPENRLLGRMNRRRLDWEGLRDTLLLVTDGLSLALGGPPTNLLARPYPPRRTLYGFIDRQNLPVLFRAFDFAAPDACTPQRFETTVPQQALFLMNGPFLQDSARRLARATDPGFSPTRAQLERHVLELHRRVLGRVPDPDEVARALTYLDVNPQGPAGPQAWTPWEEYVQALLLTNELAFVD